MKKIKIFLFSSLLLFSMSNVYSQKYKIAADTVKLNKEYLKISNDIAEISSELNIAEKDLSDYHAKAREATSNAQGSTDASSKQASKATNGDLGDAKSAKKKASKAFDNAEDARDADNKVKAQDKKIAKLTSQLQKKQQSLRALDEMRIGIRNELLLKNP